MVLSEFDILSDQDKRNLPLVTQLFLPAGKIMAKLWVDWFPLEQQGTEINRPFPWFLFLLCVSN